MQPRGIPGGQSGFVCGGAARAVLLRHGGRARLAGRLSRGNSFGKLQRGHDARARRSAPQRQYTGPLSRPKGRLAARTPPSRDRCQGAVLECDYGARRQGVRAARKSNGKKAPVVSPPFSLPVCPKGQIPDWCYCQDTPGEPPGEFRGLPRLLEFAEKVRLLPALL